MYHMCVLWYQRSNVIECVTSRLIGQELPDSRGCSCHSIQPFLATAMLSIVGIIRIQHVGYARVTRSAYCRDQWELAQDIDSETCGGRSEGCRRSKELVRR